MEIHVGANIRCGADMPWSTSPWSRGMPEVGCDPVGSLCWSRLLAGPVASWSKEPTLEEVCWPRKGTHTGPVCPLKAEPCGSS
ncbi:hypothetical protein RLOC_00007323 [Lonchura striata]|uniref:Uncharacterized protein n=1 Tax=Lonchura striata TaxID=40157 RepID=A0A218VCQ1_9PASE|nr:hypothetical protein RLOC_00007323 [Lonchura striata domestica]